jgi:F-type H+-transporting ATPase subunit delta
MPQTLARRYALAFAEAAGPGADLHRLLRDLNEFATVYEESAELRELFETPAVPLERKTKVLETILARLEAAEVTVNFLRVLLGHYRMSLLREICAVFEDIVNDRLGIVRMSVTSASPLSEEQRAALRDRFRELTQKTVEIEYHVDPEMLGGVLAQVKSTIYDGTIRGYLNRIREEMGAGG